MTTVPTQIVDKNGKKTTVHKKIDTGVETTGRASAAATPSKAVVEPPKSPAEELAESIRNSEKTYSLYYVSQGQGLEESQISAYLSGDDEGALNEIFDGFSDQSYEYATDEAKSAAREAGIDWDDLDSDEQDEIRFSIQDKDDGGLINDLLRETGDQLMRAKLTPNIQGAMADYENENDVSDFENDDDSDFSNDNFWDTARDGSHAMAPDARRLVLTKLLGDKGFEVNSAESQELIKELIAHGPEDWHEGVAVDVIWNGDVRKANVGEWENGVKKDTRTLTFEGETHVLLLDTWNGSGHEVAMNAVNVNVTLTSDNPAFLDSDSSGYGWDQVAGVVHSAYNNDPDSVWK